MTSAAKLLSSPSLSSSSASAPAVRPAPAVRSGRWGWLRLLRESFGGALLLVVWLALWTVTWAAVAGPLSPLEAHGAAPERPARVVERVAGAEQS